MGITKNPILRYQVLDRCFRNTGRNYSFEDLLDECNRALTELDPEANGIKRRQLFEDIRFMESPQGYSIPLERIKDGHKVYYRYSEISFSINNQPLNELELYQIRSTLLTISKFKGLPQFEWMEDIMTRLEKLLHIKRENRYFIGLDTNEFLEGIEFLGPVFNAIYYKRVLLIKYKAFKAIAPEKFTVHPYFLKQYNNRWFAFGFCPKLDRLQTLPLDRIKEITEIQDDYIENTRYDFSEYFDDIVGVSIPENIAVLDIRLWFSTSQAPYILTKPIHGSQRKISHDEAGLIVALKLIPNYELEQLILSFGENAEVLHPMELRERIYSRLVQATGKYSK